MRVNAPNLTVTRDVAIVAGTPNGEESSIMMQLGIRMWI
jgi:hypothetical protein